jgi:orotate phosphoribosyltransferase
MIFDTDSILQKRLALIRAIEDFALIRVSENSKGPKAIVMASGQKTDVYFNMKGVTLRGESLSLVSELFLNELIEHENSSVQIAGVSVGGDPLVAGVLLKAYQYAHQKQVLSGLLVRKEAKSHGLSQGKAVDGEPPTGQGVWLLEDVVSTGGSSLKALGFLENEGYKLKGLLTLLDREMGGLEAIQKKYPSLKVLSLFKLSEFVSKSGP